ncbi:pseudouridine synthase, partial [Opitutaceae bacterium TAV4]
PPPSAGNSVNVSVGLQPLRDPSAKVNPLDPARPVFVDGEALDHPGGLLLMLHKPTGFVCSHDEREGPRVYDLLPPRWRVRNPQVTSIGRLDKDTSGLLILTDRTELVHTYTSPRHKVPKLYRATLDRDVPASLVDLFAAGTLQLDGEKAPCAPATLRLPAPRVAELVLVEGKYHQVRRMFAAAAGATVLTLHRECFGKLTLGDLKPGEYREINESEI